MKLRIKILTKDIEDEDHVCNLNIFKNQIIGTLPHTFKN